MNKLHHENLHRKEEISEARLLINPPKLDLPSDPLDTPVISDVVNSKRNTSRGTKTHQQINDEIAREDSMLSRKEDPYRDGTRDDIYG